MKDFAEKTRIKKVRKETRRDAEEGMPMEQFSRILVPVDGSPGSLKALDAAALLAKAGGATLDILTVAYFASETDTENLVSWLPESVTRPIGPVVHDALSHAEERVRGLVPYELHERTGIPAEAILRVAAEHAQEPIVVGGRGLGRVEGFFLGSVSQEVMERAPGTVIVVK